MVKFFLIILLSLFFACNNEPARPTIPAEHINPAKDQAERRKRSEEYCKQHGIPVYNNPNALFLDPEEEVNTRNKDEVVDRALALNYVGLKGEGLEKNILEEIDKKYRVMQKLSPKEKGFAGDSHPSQQELTDATWKYEGLHVLLWALGFIDSLSYPDKQCNVPADLTIIKNMTEEEFRQKAKLRSKKEILDQADLALRINWACVDANINDSP